MQNSTRSFTDKLLLVLKGLAMGAANKVPGISGGIVAFVAGFYEEFIYSLQKINLTSLRLILNFRFRSFWTYINGPFLGLLITGMLISYFSVSKILDYFLEKNEIYFWGLFFGLIIGSLISITKSYTGWNIKNYIWLIIGISIGLIISLIEPATENDNLFFVFICGIIGVSGMTLPGLSGSFILMLIGNYVLLLIDSVNALSKTFIYLLNSDYSFLENVTHMRLLSVLLVFTLGSLTGLVSLSHALGYVLKYYKKQTYALIIGFITGSLGVVWPWKNKIYQTDITGKIIVDTNGNSILEYYQRYIPNLEFETYITCIWILVGIASVVYLDTIGNKKTTE